MRPSPTRPEPSTVSTAEQPTPTPPAIALVQTDAQQTEQAPDALDLADQGDGEGAEDGDGDGDGENFDWRPFIPVDPNDHVATIRLAAAASGCGVPWELLAAIARVESDFGRNMSTSSAGAVGYGQFLPTSWQAFGQHGNAYDYRDALPAIARYLCRHGVARDPRQAIFAYNHADWYVDLILGLAARYDRVAPGGPTQQVLELGPGKQPDLPLRFAAGRDAQAQSRPRPTDAGAVWLPISFKGRGGPNSSTRDAALAMLRSAFGLSGSPARPGHQTAGDDLLLLANDAWDDGLDLLGGPGAYHTWSLDDARAYLASGHPVVALVHARLLPGHAPDEEDADQPIVLLGLSGDRFIYSDPSFASSLGYALDLSGPDLQAAWERSATPRRAVAFAGRAPAPAREVHAIPTEPTATEVPVVPARATAARPSIAQPTSELPEDATSEPTIQPTAEPLAGSPDVELAAADGGSLLQVGVAGVALAIIGLAAALGRRLPR